MDDKIGKKNSIWLAIVIITGIALIIGLVTVAILVAGAETGGAREGAKGLMRWYMPMMMVGLLAMAGFILVFAKLTPNVWIGYRTSRTLDNPGLFRFANKCSGILMLILSLILLVVALPLNILKASMGLTIGLTVGISVVGAILVIVLTEIMINKRQAKIAAFIKEQKEKEEKNKIEEERNTAEKYSEENRDK